MNPVDFETIEEELALYERGRQLRVVHNTPAWETLVGVLEDYRDRALRQLVDLAPGDPTVPTTHAAASALDDLVAKFQQDINHAIDTAAEPSDELTAYLNGVIQSLDVARTTGHEV